MYTSNTIQSDWYIFMLLGMYFMYIFEINNKLKKKP